MVPAVLYVAVFVKENKKIKKMPFLNGLRAAYLMILVVSVVALEVCIRRVDQNGLQLGR